MVNIASTGVIVKCDMLLNGLADGTNTYFQFQNAGSNIFYLGSDAGATGGAAGDINLYTYSTNSLHLSTGGSKRLTILNTGNVGININNPLEKLHLSVGNVEGIRITSTNAPVFRLYSTNGTTDARNWQLTTNYFANGDFHLMRTTTNSGNPDTSVISATKDGYLGIGITPAGSYRLNLPNGTSAADGITWGTDTNIYRSAANTLRTDDLFYSDGLYVDKDSSGDVVCTDFTNRAHWEDGSHRLISNYKLETEEII